MTLKQMIRKIKLGDVIEQMTIRNDSFGYGADKVMGMTITKELIPTKADVRNADLSKFLVVRKNWFVMNPRTHGKKIGLAFNNNGFDILISWNNITFRVIDELIIDPNYLFIYFKRSEWDREATFRSWGSSTEVFSFETLCEMEILLPDIEIQKKYVSIYNSLLSNLRCFEQNLSDLKLVCDSGIEGFKRTYPMKPISDFAYLVDERNTDNKFKNVYGLTVYKKFIKTKADLTNVSLTSYKIVREGDIAFVPTTNRNGDKIACGLCEESCIVSQIYEVMRLDTTIVNPRYVFMWFLRTEMDRYARYNSWGSARENISWEDLSSYKIPLPPLEVQLSLVRINESFSKRKQYVDELKTIISGICPILIQGSILEAKRRKQ